MGKIAAGYYKMEYKGFVIEVTKAETVEPNWYSEISLNGDMVCKGEDWHSTKGACLEAAKYVCDHPEEYGIKYKI